MGLLRAGLLLTQQQTTGSAGKAKSYYQEFMLLEVGEEVVLQSMNEIGAN